MKQVEKIKQDVRVDSVYKDSDGWWLILKDGYNWMSGQIIHEYTIKDLYESLRIVRAN